MRLAFISFFWVLILSVESAVVYIDQNEISDHKGKCYDESGQLFYNKGEIIRNEGSECVEKKCLGLLEETGKLRIEILTCPAVEAGPGYSVIQDPSKPYPKCCPQLISMPSAQPIFRIPASPGEISFKS